jgi:molecular chaperone DnaK (HSP70)
MTAAKTARAARGQGGSGAPSRYVVGIDLGTTNSVMARVDVEAAEPTIDLVPIPQVVQAKQIEAREALPSFLYLAGEEEQGTLDVPWETGRDFAVGCFARDRGAEVPHRLVASAKSWLCNGRADRTADRQSVNVGSAPGAPAVRDARTLSAARGLRATAAPELR